MKEDKLKKYNPQEIEEKWQKVWEENGTFSPDMDGAKKSFYNLMMFPYPSAEGLHVGNMYAFTGADVYARYMRMRGYDVFEPIGLDGFGIHSENYAIKTGRHPKEQAEKSGKNFYRQLKSIGNSFDWGRTLETYDPEYYKWTQWIFVQLFKKGLAERKRAEVNFCPNCKTVLADEQVIKDLRFKTDDSGEKKEVTINVCERCGSEVEIRELEQWFFKITEYADRLLENIEGLDWSERVKIAQKNWIGKSTGAEVKFELFFEDEKLNENRGPDGEKAHLKIFTTRPDTLFGATFLVLSPEHLWVRLATDENHKGVLQNAGEVRDYVEEAKLKDVRTRQENKEKSGVRLLGVEAINPVTGKKIPVFVGDYVLLDYGTGVVMGVPGHDARDCEFAKKFGLEIIKVVEAQQEFKVSSNSADKQSEKLKVKTDSKEIKQVYEGEGVLVNSGEWNGWEMPRDILKIIKWLEERGIGLATSQYHLRDWLISRQRYWGPPIPMIFCKNCAERIKSKEVSMEDKTKGEILNPGWMPVPEDQLPVELPDVEDFQPKGDGLSPLANIPEFVRTKCPACGGEARRETDVSDTFLDSSWYFLRYTSTEKNDFPFDKDRIKKWLPVDIYIGGAEHSVLHLLYARFVTMALHDMGYLNFEEPFKKFYAHGLLIKDGAKMSKSKGNVIVPDEYIDKYGADTFRMYLRFLGPFEQGGDFSDEGIEGMNRFIKRTWRMLSKDGFEEGEMERVRLEWMNRTLQRVGDDLLVLKYNTAIAALMEYYNFLSKYIKLYKDEFECYVKMLAPFAPYMTEEIWQEFQKREHGFSQIAGDVRQSFTESSHTSLRESRQMNGDSKDDEGKTKSTFNSPAVEKSVLNEKGADEFFKSIHFEKWPEVDAAMLSTDESNVIIQVNGKKRGEIKIKADKIKEKERIEKLAEDKVRRYILNRDIIKIIHVPGKIVNFVIKDGR